MNIKIGSKVKCIKGEGWITYKEYDTLEDKVFPNPVFGEIYIIENFIILKEEDTRIDKLGLDDKLVFTLEGMGEQCFTTRRFELVEY